MCHSEKQYKAVARIRFTMVGPGPGGTATGATGRDENDVRLVCCDRHQCPSLLLLLRSSWEHPPCRTAAGCCCCWRWWWRSLFLRRNGIAGYCYPPGRRAERGDDLGLYLLCDDRSPRGVTVILSPWSTIGRCHCSRSEMANGKLYELYVLVKFAGSVLQLTVLNCNSLCESRCVTCSKKP
jgi:hypothetical protein